MKYIRFEKLGFILFPDSTVHADVAAYIKDIPKSAGFVDSLMNCYGQSTSLGLRSHVTDTMRLQHSGL